MVQTHNSDEREITWKVRKGEWRELILNTDSK